MPDVEAATKLRKKKRARSTASDTGDAGDDTKPDAGDDTKPDAEESSSEDEARSDEAPSDQDSP